MNGFVKPELGQVGSLVIESSRPAADERGRRPASQRELIAFRLESIGLRLELTPHTGAFIASRIESIAPEVEFIALGTKFIASGVELIPLEHELFPLRQEFIASGRE